jgi:hypothetical protein
MDDASPLSHGVELDAIADGDLVSERFQRIREHPSPHVALQHQRPFPGRGADRYLFSQDSENGSDESRRDLFHGENGSML